jgi:hypothetical protein
MTDYTNHIRKAATWIDRHPNIARPSLSAGTNGVILSWHMQDSPSSDERAVLNYLRQALGDVPWEVHEYPPSMWTNTEVDGITFRVFVKARSAVGTTASELTARMNS